MRKIIVFVLVVLSSLLSVAQTQQGYVKTKGRLGNDGQVIAGVRLAEATISLSDQKNVSQESGAFSFEVSNKKYTICDVLKEGYMCYDDDQLGEYEYSSKPLILVIERSDEHKSDKQQAQQKLSRIMSSQLQQRRNELEELKDDNTITQQEYQRLRKHLYSSSDNNDHLIESMAERYASLDFDQMDEEDRMIKNLILNGELNKVDSIINAKGNLEDRITLYKTHKEVSKHVRQENVIRKNRFNNEDIVDNELREIAEDCMNKFERKYSVNRVLPIS